MHVCLILFPGFPALAAALLTAVLRAANACAGQALFSCRIRTVGAARVTGDDGMTVAADAQDWEGAQGFDLVVLCAGPSSLGHLPLGMRAFLSRAAEAGACLAGIGDGAVILGTLGFLADREAVLPDELPDGFLDRHPDIRQGGAGFVYDHDRLTARGGLATADALLAWVARQRGPSLAAQAAQRLALGGSADLGARMELAQHPDPLIARMQGIMAAHMEAPLSLSQIAAEMSLTPKQLRGRCHKVLGHTPAEAYTALRLDRAAQLVEETAMPVAEVAAACGFASPSAFTRSFRARFGHSPRAARKSGDAPVPGWAEATEAATPSFPTGPQEEAG